MGNRIDTRGAICRLLEGTHRTPVHIAKALEQLDVSHDCRWGSNARQNWLCAIDAAVRAGELRPFVEMVADEHARTELDRLVTQYENELAPAQPELIDPARVVIRGASGASLAQTRLFSEHYDSVRQAAALGRAPTNAVRSLSARLRLDLLISQRLVLTDAQVLDGPLLHALAVDGPLLDLAREWQVWLPARPMLEIRARSSDLHDSLVAMVGGGRADKMLGEFLFATLPAEMAAVQEALAEFPADAIGSPEELAAALRKAGAPDDHVARMQEAWSVLADLPEDFACRARWDSNFKDAWVEAFKADPLEFGEKANFESAWGRRQLPGEFRSFFEERNRAKAKKRLSLLRKQAPSVEALRDVRRLELWYDRNYNRALAIQHGCASEWVSRDDDPVLYPEQDVTRDLIRPNDGELMKEIRRRGREQGLVGDVVDEFSARLADLPAAEYARFLAGNEVSGALDRWYAMGEVGALRRVLEMLSRLLEGVQPQGEVEEFARASRAHMSVGQREDERSFELTIACLIDDQSLDQRTLNHTEVREDGAP